MIKIGGSIADEQQSLEGILKSILTMRNLYDVILVHGGGAEISRNLKLLEEPVEFINGLRVTTLKALQMVEMTLSGSVNKKLVSLLNRLSQNTSLAVGVSGVDGSTLICEPVDKSLGRVGRIKKVNLYLLTQLLQGGFTPVLSPISVDENAQHFNVNADEAASAVAMAFNADKLIFISDVSGVWDKEKKVIPILNIQKAEELIQEGTVKEGMIPKINSCIKVLKSGVSEVHICGWKNENQLVNQMTGKGDSGSLITI